MPLYEYVCEQDGEVIELRRSMAEADRPVEDPKKKGRTFVRKLSNFQAKSGSASSATSLNQAPGFCPCGQPGGGCGSMN